MTGIIYLGEIVIVFILLVFGFLSPIHQIDVLAGTLFQNLIEVLADFNIIAEEVGVA